MPRTPAAWPTSYWKRWTPWRPPGPGKALKGRLEVLLRQRILDWRPALADGSLAAEPRLRRWPWPKLRKTATSTCCNACAMPAATSPKPCADAAACWRPASPAAPGAAGWLLDQGVAVHQDSLQIGAAHLDALLAERLLRLGAVSEPNTVLLALQYGDADAARIMARPLLEESSARASALRLARQPRRARAQRRQAGQVGKMGSNRSPDDYPWPSAWSASSPSCLAEAQPSGPCTSMEGTVGQPLERRAASSSNGMLSSAFSTRQADVGGGPGGIHPGGAEQRQDAVVGVQHRAQADVGGGPGGIHVVVRLVAGHQPPAAAVSSLPALAEVADRLPSSITRRVTKRRAADRRPRVVLGVDDVPRLEDDALAQRQVADVLRIVVQAG